MHDELLLRPLIQDKIADGFLPRARMTHIWGGPGLGEICSACGETIAKDQLGIEGGDGATIAVHLHLRCFQVWDEEVRRQEVSRGYQAQ